MNNIYFPFLPNLWYRLKHAKAKVFLSTNEKNLQNLHLNPQNLNYPPKISYLVSPFGCALWAQTQGREEIVLSFKCLVLLVEANRHIFALRAFSLS